MQEKKIEIKGINPLELFGVNNSKLQYLKSFFPKLKIVGRGNEISVSGDLDEIENFERKFNLIIKHYHKYNSVTENNIENLLLDGG
ncbi:MAG: phosphate starvation-inducible protein PhoH, partial [Crocinitomicaceae bacterium]|nr:phosphate starvation-inducible protein PhoH [Crocinitomicaceae bacterium]